MELFSGWFFKCSFQNTRNIEFGRKVTKFIKEKEINIVLGKEKYNLIILIL